MNDPVIRSSSMMVDLENSSVETIAWTIAQLSFQRQHEILDTLKRVADVNYRCEEFKSLAGLAGAPCYAGSRKLGTILKVTDNGHALLLSVGDLKR